MRMEIYSSMSPMPMITIHLSRLIRNISMVRAIEGGGGGGVHRRRGSQIIVSRRVKVKWLSRGTIDAEEKVVLEAYDSRLCTLLNGLMVIYREGIDGLFVCLLLPTQRTAAREPFRHHN